MTGATTSDRPDSGRGLSTRRLLAVLFREEWRMHTQLFGGWRFAVFPVVIAVLAVSGTVALLETGTARGTIIGGLHALAVGFGLYSGTAGFAGSDMLENVFGRLSLLLSSSATLPLSRRRLLGVFLLKDALFYGVAFVLPMALASAALRQLSASTPLTIGLFWLSLWLVFAAGMATTVALIAARTRGVPPWAIGLAIGLTVVGTWATGSLSVVQSVLVPVRGAALAGGGLAEIGRAHV